MRFSRRSAKRIVAVHHDCLEKTMAGQGSGGNVLAALCSLFIPGLGQLLQGRLLTGYRHVCFSGSTLVFLLRVDYSPLGHHRRSQVFSILIIEQPLMGLSRVPENEKPLCPTPSIHTANP